MASSPKTPRGADDAPRHAEDERPGASGVAEPHRSRRERAPAVETMTTVVYVLYIAGLGGAVPGIVGMLIAYGNRGGAANTWLASHVQFQIRTFWLGLPIAVGGLILAVAGIGIALLLGFAIWVAVRSVRGLRLLSRGEPVGNPDTLLW